MAIIPVFQKILSKFHDDCSSNDDRLFYGRFGLLHLIFIMLVTIHTTIDASSEVSRKS